MYFAIKQVDKSATVQDMLQKISEGRCYGYLEGFEHFPRLKYASDKLRRYACSYAEDNEISTTNMYVLEWGS